MLKSEDKKTFLLLRPFDFDAFVSILSRYLRTLDSRTLEDYEKDRHKGRQWRDSFEPVEMFDALATALRARGTLIAVGQRKFGHRGGPGLLTLEDDDWQNKVAKLMERTDLIFLMPWPTTGTEWELNEILTNAMVEKTVFIMPPSYGISVMKREEDYISKYTREFYFKAPEDHLAFDSPLRKVEEGYSKAVAALAQAGLDVPEYEIDGRVFFYKNGKVYTSKIPYNEDDMDGLLDRRSAIFAKTENIEAFEGLAP